MVFIMANYGAWLDKPSIYQLKAPIYVYIYATTIEQSLYDLSSKVQKRSKCSSLSQYKYKWYFRHSVHCKNCLYLLGNV